MFQIKNVFSIAVIVFGLTVCFAIDARAQAIPGGSYQQTCTAVSLVNAVNLKAQCLTKSEGAPPSWYDKLSGAGKEFSAGHPPSTLENYYLCVGDISNNNGNLTCQKNENSPQMKLAKKAVDDGLQNALGYKSNGNLDEYLMYIRELFKAGMGDAFFKGWNAVMTAQYYKNYLAAPDKSAIRAVVIEDAVKDATGLAPSAERLAFYDAEIRKSKIGHAEIMLFENDRQNSNEITRKLLILRTYKEAMGRAPKPAEQGYWFPRKDNYSQLIAAHRNWLYSTQGAKDLTETIKRALEEKHVKKSVNDTDIKSAMTKYAAGKKIYDEM